MKIQEGRVSIDEDVVIGKAGTRDLLADIFLPPKAEEDRPAILVVHGGGWLEGDKSQ